MKELRATDNVQSLHLGDGYTDIHICQNSVSCAVKMCAFY